MLVNRCTCTRKHLRLTSQNRRHKSSNIKIRSRRQLLLSMKAQIKTSWCSGEQEYPLHIQHMVNISFITQFNFDTVHIRENERDLTQSYDKSPYTDRKIQKATWQHKNATINFDYSTFADRLRTVSWGNDSHPTCVVKPVYGIPIFPLTAKAV